MKVDESLTMEQIFAMPNGVWDKSSEVLGDMIGDATLVWRDEIQNGYAEETYSDVPFLVPYIVPGSDKCVISCPGGAYLSKSMEGEGQDIAEFLNAAGISCFVLWYRTYPYKAPLMYLDCQRAVRYVRYHAAEYGINPNKIATVGFSAGGNLCGVQALCFGDAAVDIEGYIPDAIDEADGRPNAVGMCYPAVSLEDDKALACIAGVEIYNDKTQRYAFAAKYDMRTHVRAGAAPAFLCNCMDDDVLPPMRLAELADAYKKQNVDCELHIFPKGGHGFGGCVERPNPFSTPDYSKDAPHDYAIGFPNAESWSLGDSAAIGVLLSHTTGHFKEVKAPNVNPDGTYRIPENGKRVRWYTDINHRFILEDFFARVKYYALEA